MSQDENAQQFNHAVGQVLQSARAGAGLNPEKLAELSDIDERVLTSLEKGETPLDVYLLHRLAQAFGVPAPALLESAIRLHDQQRNSAVAGDNETREAGELIRRFLHVEGSSRGEKFMHLVNELKKGD